MVVHISLVKNYIFQCFILIILFVDISFTYNHLNDINDLKVYGDYRSIKLKWTYPDGDDQVSSFKIRYCELNNWPSNKNRCKDQTVGIHSNHNEPLVYSNSGVNIPDNGNINHQENDHPQNSVVEFKNMGSNHYEASINSLRVQTNYSVSIEANLKDSDDFNHPSTISSDTMQVTTKSFNAKTLKCLANSSEIQVFTGPYFNGRISVEGSDHPSCFLNGNGNNPQDSYNFTINHELCKSKTIDNTRIETMVLVNENREILTHNSRRYLVICGFDPDKYTLTASVAVPNFLLRRLFDRLKYKSPVTVQKFDPSLQKDKRKTFVY